MLRVRPGRNELRARPIEDPDLQAIADIADQRRPRMNEDLERAFERVKPILNRKPASESSIRYPDLPPDLKVKVLAMPDAEERIRAIVEFKLSARPRVDKNR